MGKYGKVWESMGKYGKVSKVCFVFTESTDPFGGDGHRVSAFCSAPGSTNAAFPRCASLASLEHREHSAVDSAGWQL